MTKYNQLLKEQRETIEYMIGKKHTFTSIGKAINKDRTTIAKEVKRNRYIKSYFYEAFDPKGISEAIKKCPKLQEKPYVCNVCPLKHKCNKHKLYYNASIAQKHYEETLVSSRQGVDITLEEIDEIEHAIVPLIKDKKQSVNQVYNNHSDILYFSKVTFYKYVNIGVFSLKNIDLPKKVSYKVRKKKDNTEETQYKRKMALLKGRSYDDYLDFILKHPNMNICEMDTVEGNKQSSKVLLTIIIKNTRFMLIRLLDKKNVQSVNYQFDLFKNKLGIKLYSKVFRIILTDNGSEFFDPLHIEYDYNTGSKKTNVFYCKPYSSWQKGTIEKNHEFIRKIFPKGTSFDNMTSEQIQKLEDTINNIPRDSLNGKTPYELTHKKYPELIKSLNCSYISPDDVCLTKKAILEIK